MTREEILESIIRKLVADGSINGMTLAEYELLCSILKK